MKVEELIEKLKEMPQDAEIIDRDGGEILVLYDQLNSEVIIE